MNTQLRIVLLIAVCVYFFSIFYFLRKKSLALKYTLLWLFWGFMMLIILIFPKLLDVVGWLGIYSPVNGIFAITLFGVLVILISLTSIVSKQSEKIRTLIQYNAELEKRVRELEKTRNR